MKKGQVAIEFIFILLVIIIYIFTVTKPIIQSGEGAVSDIDSIASMKRETQKITNAINRIYLLGDNSKETITLFIPQENSIFCNSNTIGFIAKINKDEINPPLGVCPENSCEYIAETFSGITINCQQESFSSGQHTIQIQKVNGNIVVGEN